MRASPGKAEQCVTKKALHSNVGTKKKASNRASDHVLTLYHGPSLSGWVEHDYPYTEACRSSPLRREEGDPPSAEACCSSGSTVEVVGDGDGLQNVELKEVECISIMNH